MHHHRLPSACRPSFVSWPPNGSKVFPDKVSWRSEDTVRLTNILATRGVDFLDVSSRGNNIKQKIKGGQAHQALFAHDVKKGLYNDSNLIVGLVDSMTNGHIAQEVLDKGQADVTISWAAVPEQRVHGLGVCRGS